MYFRPKITFISKAIQNAHYVNMFIIVSKIKIKRKNYDELEKFYLTINRMFIVVSIDILEIQCKYQRPQSNNNSI